MPGARRAWKAAALALFVGYEIVAYFFLRDSLGVQAVSGLTHAACYLIMLWYFGRTLLPGEQPLITRLASSVHGPLAPDHALFTRRFTIAWCLFFAGQILVSALLLAFAPFDVWSLFINLLNFPLLILMFVAGYLVRMVRFRDQPRVSIARILRAFAEVASEGSKAR